MKLVFSNKILVFYWGVYFLFELSCVFNRVIEFSEDLFLIFYVISGSFYRLFCRFLVFFLKLKFSKIGFEICLMKVS